MNLRGLLASPFGFLIGLVMGALGGGGAVLAVPALVYLAGQDPKDATASALLIVMCTALGGLVAHSRDGTVRWNVGLVFGTGGVAGALIGSGLHTFVNDETLLLAFSVLLLVVSGFMFHQARHPVSDDDPGLAVTVQFRGHPRRVGEILGLGLVIGTVTGFFGVGGGFILVPVLTVILKFPVRVAVGTSLLVISINSLVSLIARQAWGSIEWSVAIPFTIAALVGVTAGNALARRVDSATLIQAFAVLLVAVATYTGIDSLLAL
ncbi:MAG: sulfite exporter TauE/SafE family protein [Acidimicrobiia bacterium]|nr:sulfite exporter TauE/SafE family protein [Acidimicrobiia bacterium]